MPHQNWQISVYLYFFHHYLWFRVRFKYKKSFDKIYPDLSKKYDLAYIPFLLEGVALNPELNLNDGMHPNSNGVKIISKTLEEKIIPLVK